MIARRWSAARTHRLRTKPCGGRRALVYPEKRRAGPAERFAFQIRKAARLEPPFSSDAPRALRSVRREHCMIDHPVPDLVTHLLPVGAGKSEVNSRNDPRALPLFQRFP